MPQDAGTVRVIAGELGGTYGPAKTFTPINLWDVELHAGKSVNLGVPIDHTTAGLVLSGEILLNDAQPAAEGDLAVLSCAGDRITLHANSSAKLLMMSGEPIAEPVVGHGPFVVNSQAEIQQAFEEYQPGRMGELAEA